MFWEADRAPEETSEDLGQQFEQAGAVNVYGCAPDANICVHTSATKTCTSLPCRKLKKRSSIFPKCGRFSSKARF